MGEHQQVKAGTLNAIISRLTSDTQYGLLFIIIANVNRFFIVCRYKVFVNIYYYVSVLHNTMESTRKAYAKVISFALCFLC